MQITEIVPLDKQRSKVLTDEDFAFALYKGELRRYQIKSGTEISQEVYREIVETVLCRRARERALYLLKMRDRTEQEIRRKLEEGFYPREVIERTLEFLREYGFVNDREYARQYVEIYGKRRSRRRIQNDLAQKGLDRDQIAELLDEGNVEEEAQIEAFLRRKHYDPQETSFEDKQKMTASLVRRGYAYETVSQVIKNLDTSDKTV